jgi:urea ABC transporter permease protein UrtC
MTEPAPPAYPLDPRQFALVRAVRAGGWRAPVLWFDRAGAALAAAVLLIAVPALYLLGLADLALVSQLGRYAALALVAIGLDLVWGYAGILSLCQALFFTLGGYACGMYLCMHGPMDGAGIPRALFVVSSQVGGMALPGFWKPFAEPWFAALMVVAVPGLVAFAIGYGAFRSRIKGVYLSIITQALTIAAWLLFCRNDLHLCGTNGLTNFTQVLGADLRLPETKLALYVLSVLALFAALAGARWLTATRFGRILLAVRDSEARLRFAGYQPVWFKTAAFVIAGVLAGLGGALYTPQTGIITPANLMAIESIWVVVWVAVGGRGTVAGAVVGCLAVKLLEARLTTWLPDWWMAIIGAIFIAVVLFLPDGLVGRWRRLRAKAAGA